MDADTRAQGAKVFEGHAGRVLRGHQEAQLQTVNLGAEPDPGREGSLEKCSLFVHFRAMGKRNIDRYSIQERYHQGRTVGDMLGNRWEVMSKCYACQLEMVTSLPMIIKLRGPNVRLWNRKERCRRLFCNGVVHFWGKAPGMVCYAPLEIDDELHE